MSFVDPPRLVLGGNVLYPLALRDGGVLLVDAGPDIPATEESEDSWASLTMQLAAHGIEVGDVRFALVTHAHLDHAGLAYRWAEVGATILAGGADIAAIAAGQASRDSQRAAQLADIVRHGCSEEMVQQMRSPRSGTSLRWEACPEGALAPSAGSYDLAEGRTLQVIEAPGHTPGNLVGYIAETGELFSGDTILPTTVPTPGMHYPDAVQGVEQPARWPSLPPFIDSVTRIRELEVRRILPGHGELVEEPSKLFERFEQHHARRAQRVRAALGDGPISAYGIARRMFPRIPPRRLGQAITEVLGHLDLLERAGAVAWVERGAGIEAELVG